MKYALYDMSSQSTSFTFLVFCIMVKAQCEAMGEECYVIFKKGPNRGFKDPHDSPYSLAEKQFRLTHMLYPICTMMGMDYSTEGTDKLFPKLEESDMLRPKDRVSLSDMLRQYKETPMFWPQPSERAMEIVQKEFPEPPVVITLRETYAGDRNSNVKEWIKFAGYVYKTNKVVSVRDTNTWNEDLLFSKDNLGQNLEPFNTFPLASTDLDIRLALYKHAKINFSVGGGSTTLLRFSTDIPYRTFKYMINKEKCGERPIATGRPISEESLSNPKIQDQMNENKHVVVSQEYLNEQFSKGNFKLSLPNNEGGYSLLDFKHPNNNKESRGAGSEESLRHMGFPPGSQFPWHTENQKIIWEEDDFENLKREYDKWLKQYG